MSRSTTWVDICGIDEILMQAGVCALVDEQQVAVFRTPSGLFAIDNRDPVGGANVLSRGIVGDVSGRIVVASPLYKHHYDLATGECLEQADARVRSWRVREMDGRVLVETRRNHVLSPTSRRRLVVVGHGMASLRMLEELVAIAPDRYEIDVFGAEARGGYNRVLLSGVLGGEKAWKDISGHDDEWYASRGIRVHAGDPVECIDRIHRTVVSASGKIREYDRLVLATGASPTQLPVPGHDLPGVVRFRDIADVERMLEAAGRGGRAVVIGGGLLGVEAAAGLLQRSMDVTLVHNSDTLMDRQLDSEAGSLLRESLEARGLRFRMGASTVAIDGDGRAEAVWLADGSTLAADLVVTAVGIRPNIGLALAAGLRCDRGVLVDDTMQTFDPRVYAIGECVQHRSTTFGLVAPLWEQARVCAVHLAEVGVSRYSQPPAATHLKVSGVRVFSAGNLAGGPGVESIVLRDPSRGIYKRLDLRDNRIQGAVLYGDVSGSTMLCELLREGRNVSAIRDRLLFDESASIAP